MVYTDENDIYLGKLQVARLLSNLLREHMHHLKYCFITRSFFVLVVFSVEICFVALPQRRPSASFAKCLEIYCREKSLLKIRRPSDLLQS